MKDLLLVGLLLPILLAAALTVAPVFVPNILVSGEPGSGKSYGIAHVALSYRGSLYSGDPHERSTTRLLLEHGEGNILYHNVGDEDHRLGYGFLGSAPMALPIEKRRKINLSEAKQFAEIEMSRRGGNIATTPLMEEYTLAKNMLYLCNDPPKDPSIVPYAFRPGTDKFKALIRDCWDEETRDKFLALAEMTPRAVRSEVGSAARLCESNFREDDFLAACRRSFDFGAFLQEFGWLLLEKGKADKGVTATIIRAITRKIAQHCESRPEPYPPVVAILDECTNVGTAKETERNFAAENRKYGGPHMWLICQYPNFYDPDAVFQVCQEFHAYTCADEGYARKQAKKIAAKMGDFTQVDRITTELLNFKPGERYVVGRGGVRRERLPMLESPWPDWPGLREGKLQEKLCQIYQRPEYRGAARPDSGGDGTTPSPSGADGDPSPPTKPADAGSAAERWAKRKRRGGS